MRLLNQNRNDFPTDFEFGTANSSYQIEGHQFGGAGPTHWDSFSATPGNVLNGQDGGLACDHYHRFESDIALAAAAGFDTWRFSTSWARIIPEGVGTVNVAGLDFYDRLVDIICANAMRPNLTLYHWELPSALADIGGWANRDIASHFADYAETIIGRIGDRLHAVAPINEPWCVAWLSYFLGRHAPGLRDIRAAARAMHHVPLAHGQAVQAMRAMGQINIGLVVNLEYCQAADDRPESQHAAATYDALYNQWFLSSIRRKRYPSLALAGLETHLPANWADDLDIISQPVDWIGLNYYTRKLITAGPTGLFGDFTEVEGPLQKTQMGWEIYSPGLKHFLTQIWNRYADGLPIYVTENGMAHQSQQNCEKIDDQERVAFIEAHLLEVQDALRNGIDVRGYFLWTLIDNFEWSLGYDKQFGIVHVDRESLNRTPKLSYHAIKEAFGK